MPLIRCQKCGQAYDVPPVIAVKLPGSIATCTCGEWLAGSRAALLARLGSANPGDVKELDLKPYRVDAGPVAAPFPAEPENTEAESDPFDLSRPRSVRVVARGADAAVNSVFTIDQHPLWIGRKGSHVVLDDAELSIRHCSISVRDGRLFARDADSYTGTYLDGQAITEAVIDDGVHLLRLGSALVTIEPVDGPGHPVEAIELEEEELLGDSPLLLRKLQERGALKSLGDAARAFLVCIEGPLAGKEFEIPVDGLIVGREGHVRVPDEFLSRKHFEVQRDPEGIVRVRDLGSRNGTFLNTLPARNTKVQTGDEIRAGVNRFRIEQRA
jgi:pSer/pThr/pTyr-binding forkhead associated (FHA) protein